MKTENATWIGTDTDTRTDKLSINDIFCMGCRTKMARVVDHQHVYLNGWDRQAVIDLKGGTVTIKCKCGVGRVIRDRGNFWHKGDMNVWFEEADESDSGELEADRPREGQADGSNDDT